VYESEKLAAIKNHLSCPLCHQIFTSPCFLSGCGHTFCGLCLRQRFSWRNECPQCKASARPSDLTTSLALNAIVSAYLRFDARAACLQQPTTSAANVPDDIEESSINYSLSSVVEVPGDSDHEGKCSEELKQIDSAERTSLTVVTTDEMQRGEDSDEDESVWASAKLPAHRKDDNLQVFSELIHRKKKRKTFSNGDIRVFAVDNRASASSSSSTKKSLHTAAPTVTAIECSEPAILDNVLDENMDGVITTKEHCPERSYSSHKNTINLTHDAAPESYINQMGEYTSSGSSLQITEERKDDNVTDVQIHECAARAYEREETPLTNNENDSYSGYARGARDWQDSAIKYSAQKSIGLKDIDRGKDENKDGTLFASKNVAKNQLSAHEKKALSTAKNSNLEYSLEEQENVPEAIEDSPPSDSPYNPVDLTGSTGRNRNHEDIDGNSSKHYEMAAISDGKECSIEGSQVSLVISVTDNRNDTYESDNIDKNYNDNFHKKDESEYRYIEKNDDGNRNSGSRSSIGFINDIYRSEINDDGINFYDSDDDNNNESYDDNDTNTNTNNNSHDNYNQKYDYGDSSCNDDHINTNNYDDKNDKNNDRSNLKNSDKNNNNANDVTNDEHNDKNNYKASDCKMCANSDTDADNDSTQASSNCSYTAIRPDALHENTASSHLSHTESAILLGLKSNDKSSSSSRRSDDNDDNNNSSSNYNNNSTDNSNNNDHNNNSSSSSYSSSSSSQIADSHSHLINRHNPYTTTISNSTPSSSSISSSRISSSSGPHSFNSTIIPDPGPRSSPIHGLHGRPIIRNNSYTNNNVKNKHNLDGRLDYLDGVLDSQVTVGTDDTSDECHTKNWTQNLECSANGEDSCADMVDKVRVQIVCYYMCIFLFHCVMFCSSCLCFLSLHFPFVGFIFTSAFICISTSIFIPIFSLISLLSILVYDPIFSYLQ
jgi:Zinc finger, C3HC4 type (RING finger)